MTISQRIFEQLKAKHITQKQLAEYTGISTAAISSWKKYKTNPTSDKIPKICEFLNVSYEYLLTGYDSPVVGDALMHDVAYGGYGFSEAELDLIEKFRRLPELEKGRILGIVEARLTDLADSE